MGAVLPIWSGVSLRGSAAAVRIRASAHREGACERFQWFEAHPDVTASPGRRRQDRAPFVVGEVLDLVASGLSVRALGDQQARTAWIRARAARVKDRHRVYVERAAEAILDSFLDLDEEYGPLTYRGLHGEWQAPSGATLYTWAMNFDGPGGYREVRRIRVGSAHDPDSDTRAWTVHAAKILAELQWPTPCTRVVVREVGALDGSSRVHLDANPAQVANAYEVELRPALRGIVSKDGLRPGWDCPRCVLVEQCDALVPAPDALGQTRPGSRTRSIAASDLSLYGQCPARWYYTRELKLPRSPGDETGLLRGVAIHEWLRRAHERGTPCTVADLPEDPANQAWLTAQQYEVARTFLLEHVALCPLRSETATVVAIEHTYHLHDRVADLVAVTKPDLVLRRGDTLVLRETKSSQTVSAGASRAEVSSRYVQVNLGLCILDSLAAHHGCASAEFELELVTPSGGRVWSWSTANATEFAVARADVAGRVGAWLHDQSWTPAPSPLCGACDVREWCSERDAHANRPAAGGGGAEEGDLSWRPGEPF